MPTGDLQESHLRARELLLLGSTFTITGRRAGVDRHRMSFISHLELATKGPAGISRCLSHEISDWPSSPFHVSQGALSGGKRSRCLSEMAKRCLLRANNVTSRCCMGSGPLLFRQSAMVAERPAALGIPYSLSSPTPNLCLYR